MCLLQSCAGGLGCKTHKQMFQGTTPYEVYPKITKVWRQQTANGMQGASLSQTTSTRSLTSWQHVIYKPSVSKRHTHTADHYNHFSPFWQPPPTQLLCPEIATGKQWLSGHCRMGCATERMEDLLFWFFVLRMPVVVVVCACVCLCVSQWLCANFVLGCATSGDSLVPRPHPAFHCLQYRKRESLVSSLMWAWHNWQLAKKFEMKKWSFTYCSTSYKFNTWCL